MLTGARHFIAQGRLVPDGFHAVAHALRYLHQEAFGGHKGFLTFDVETDLALPTTHITRSSP